MLTDCGHYPGGITMASLQTIWGYTQYCPWSNTPILVILWASLINRQSDTLIAMILE